MKLVYDDRYNIGLFGLERFHPFESRKYGHAWQMIGRSGRDRRNAAWVRVPRPASLDDLATVHSRAYLDRLNDPRVLASALEMPFVAKLPRFAVWRAIVRPMQWAVAGSLVAAREALTHGVAVNLSGGYHHAKPDRGEGFCLFNDIAYLVHGLRAEGRLGESDRVAYIDLDVHQGNGVCACFRSDNRVFLYDAFNASIYPLYDHGARERIDCPVPLRPRCRGAEYLDRLHHALPGFLDSVHDLKLAVYNAGTDVLAGDLLGELCLSADDVLQRDLYVFQQLRERNIPVVMLLSGGYSPQSVEVVAATVIELLGLYGK